MLGLVSGMLLLVQVGSAQAKTGTRHPTRHASVKHPHPGATAHVSGHHAKKTLHQTARRAPAPAGPDTRPLIVIDPGHGGRDPGAVGVSGILEKTVTLAAALELRRSLMATGRYRVALTRTRDRTISLADRLAFARRHDADLLIAIHADASPDRRARGASVYVSSGSGSKTTRLAAGRDYPARIAEALSEPKPQPEAGSAWLQYSMIDQLSDDVRMVPAPARDAHFYVLGAPTIPSVLLEMGFLSNRKDERLIRQPANRRVLVEAIRDAIHDYFAGIRTSASHT